jgi:hypothetical protein
MKRIQRRTTRFEMSTEQVQAMRRSLRHKSRLATLEYGRHDAPNRYDRLERKIAACLKDTADRHEIVLERREQRLARRALELVIDRQASVTAFLAQSLGDIAVHFSSPDKEETAPVEAQQNIDNLVELAPSLHAMLTNDGAADHPVAVVNDGRLARR